ncbi:hypothetical protein Glove_441g17 [Diversispora epigaea]|uniref:Uncharacterized protein n=1 Tax=Diversispora epigaea TaxID=1348612 RepID=A0A397GUY7_9GLOM|nr:hypothetical protein Glove_441g17 [Diversispora epigaea]
MARYCEINLNVFDWLYWPWHVTVSLGFCAKLQELKKGFFERNVFADNYDTFVSAELSDPVEQLRLYQTVVSVMIHDPYGPSDNYDTFVSAELSDPVEQLRLYQTVVSVMIHDPYGPFKQEITEATMEFNQE